LPIPDPVRLFHITDISNLSAIFASRELLSKNVIASRQGNYKNIAYQGAQGKRANKQLPNPPGGLIHDYVPFYFAPRSPMLNAIHSGRVPDCPGGQASIVHFETTVTALVSNREPFVFFDRNATLDYSEPHTDLAHLDQVAWGMLTENPKLDGFCKYFNNNADRYVDRMERRMAEFLVKTSVPLVQLVRIGVIDADKRDEVRAMLSRSGLTLRVDVMTDWYFLGQ
jgi:ssDNA thymidine ADP-ribosyltransferase, DarT